MFPFWEKLIDIPIAKPQYAPKLGTQSMRLIGREKLDQLKGKGAEVEKWARSWVAEVAQANWRQPKDVTEQFPNARHQGSSSFMFPIANCRLAIHLQIAFAQGIALISELNTNEVTYGS